MDTEKPQYNSILDYAISYIKKELEMDSVALAFLLGMKSSTELDDLARTSLASKSKDFYKVMRLFDVMSALKKDICILDKRDFLFFLKQKVTDSDNLIQYIRKGSSDLELPNILMILKSKIGR